MVEAPAVIASVLLTSTNGVSAWIETSILKSSSKWKFYKLRMMWKPSSHINFGCYCSSCYAKLSFTCSIEGILYISKHTFREISIYIFSIILDGAAFKLFWYLVALAIYVSIYFHHNFLSGIFIIF